jgi:hypothetical protein
MWEARRKALIVGWLLGFPPTLLLLVKPPLFSRALLYLINVNILPNLFSALCSDGTSIPLPNGSYSSSFKMSTLYFFPL